MADADEDTPAPPGVPGAEGDLDDEVQDFRFLSAFASSKSASHQTLPKRGEKDFEPHGSSAQADALAGARAAMHEALSHTRTHQPKTHLVGTLDVESGMTRVHAVKGQLFRAMGRADSSGRTFLLPEEALYMLERGSLDVRWPPDDAIVDEGAELDGGDEEGKEDQDDRAQEGLSLSLQAGYALLIGKIGLSLERYQVYANLRRSGYAVFRAPGWYNDEDIPASEETSDNSIQRAKDWTPNFFLFARFTSLFAAPPRPLGPLLKPGLYRSYDDIYKQLSLIPFHDPSSTSITAPLCSGDDSSPPEENPARICWHVFKPQPSFRKSNPGPPDFRLAVLDARAAGMLDITDFDRIFAEAAPAEPPGHNNMFVRLKTGWRSAMLAVVDHGVISYLKVAEGGFGREKVYEQRPARGGKRGGGRRGRGGRGGGRGGRGGKS